MAEWFFEPGHTAAAFRARHMMVSWVRGHFKNVEGALTFDPDDPEASRVRTRIEAGSVWTGLPERDDHLRSADFLDVDEYPWIEYRGSDVRLLSANEFLVGGELTIRGVARPTELEVRYLGAWETPWWEGDRNLGPRTRAGFVATTSIDRREFGVDWQSRMENGGVVVSPRVEITLDVEAVLEE